MVLFIRKSYKRLHTILSRGQVLSVWIEMGLAPGGGNFPEKTLGRMAVSDTSGRVSPACLVSSKSAFMHTRNLFTTMLLHIGAVWARAELWDGEGRSASYTDGATVQAQCQGLLCTCRRDRAFQNTTLTCVSTSQSFQAKEQVVAKLPIHESGRMNVSIHTSIDVQFVLHDHKLLCMYSVSHVTCYSTPYWFFAMF